MITRPVVCHPFIGRIKELRFLRELKREAGLSHGGLVFVAGEAGVGKSRLISEFCSSIANSRWKVGSGACLDVASRPYWPVLEAFHSLGSPLEFVVTETKQEQFDALAEHFGAIAARNATIVVLEDLQWADAATLDFLAYLGAKLSRMRVLVIVSFRTDDLPVNHPAHLALAKITRNSRAARIDLAPLQGVELQRFIDKALAGIELPNEIRRAIARNGDGNPFFTEELLKSAVEAFESSRANGRQTVPQTVRDTLLARLLPLDDRERQVIAQAAVIGRSFRLDLLAATLETQPNSLLGVLVRLRDFQLIDEIAAGEFRFRHALTREAIYGGFLGAQTRLRHRTIAVELEKQPASQRSLEALAFHWWAAGEPAPSAAYNEQAGDSAVRVHAHEDALILYERALESDSLALMSRGVLQEKIANAQIVVTRTEQAHATYEMAADTFRDAQAYDLEARCRVRAATSAYTLRRPEPTARLHQMLARIDASEFIARSRIHIGLAWLAATLWFPTEAQQHLDEVDARALLQVADFVLHFHNISAWVAMTIGDVTRFRREYAAWVSAARAADSATTLAGACYNGALCFSFLGLHEDALDSVTRALRIARESRSRHAEECALSNATLCYLAVGDLRRARDCVEGIPTTTQNGVSLKFASALGCIVGSYLDDEDLVAKWFDGFEDIFSQSPDIETGAAFAEIMVRRGRLLDAETIIHRAMPECEMLRGNVMPLLTVFRYGALPDRARAREYLARSAAGPVELPERPALALCDAIEHLKDGRMDEAAKLGSAAAAGFRRLRYPLLEAAALEVSGDLASALAIFKRCGATRDVRRLEEINSSLKASPQAVEASTHLLSVRELEIATLASTGQTNNEIARALSIAEKTVEKHLASVYQKVGVSSRKHLRSHIFAKSSGPGAQAN